MDQNVGRADAGIRWALAAILFTVSVIFSAKLWLSLAAAIAALVLVATALTRKCPLFTFLGVSSCPHRPVTRP